ncbi:MAG: DNA polymerase III subunit alpha, partial [Tissierellia bacterium]|nr:DNA polymerase III subunit alpha [Tissierellia bacterium]
DHGVMYGTIQFYKACKKHGIKPILGCEIYVTNTDYMLKDNLNRKYYHLVVLAENEEGYQNLLKIVSEGFVNGYYYRPRVDYNILRKYSKGIIATSACLGGEVQSALLDGNYNKAKEVALLYNDIFGEGNFFLELQDHGMPEQIRVNEDLRVLSKDVNIELIASNDTHYLNKSDSISHDVLLCVQTGTTIHEENRMKFPSDEFYLKSPEEMYELFPEDSEALQNTQKIAHRCNVEIEFHNLHLPQFDVPEGYTNTEYLEYLVKIGLNERYDEITKEIEERYKYEYDTIVKMGYIDYFLIVWDFVRYAKENDIPVGPGRGSAAGALISYALGITDVDPLKYSLLFERFLNPERVSMPDIDIDFCYERREEVIKYVIDKYGADRVGQIVTFGTMAAKGAIRDVGRALDMTYGKVDYIAKLIPGDIGMTIKKALDISKELEKNYEEDLDVKRLIDFAISIEGLPRHTSTHAAGVLISKEPVTEYVPLTRNGDIIATQFNMIELEELGLLKMDFLGLRTLTVLKDAVELVKANHGVDIDFDKIDYEDADVLKMFAKANTLGIFQFESAGMRAFLKELEPNVFENLIAANSLFRPGPMNQIPTFVEWKKDPSKIKYIHPKLESILDVTYGCIVYQEQVMQIVREIGGYSFGRADLVRRAMSKKKMDVMEQERKKFVFGETDGDGNVVLSGAIRNGVDEKSANKIFDLMIDFANYAFNKSHSVAYAIVAFRTAWLKYYYPVEFMAALISSVLLSSKQVAQYIDECKRLNIEVLRPDINKSFKKFTVDDGKIRFGLLAIKGVGENAIDAIVKARDLGGDFTNFKELIERVEEIDSTAINKRVIESLIRSGALDEIGPSRAQLLAVFEEVINSIHAESKRNIAGQANLFDILANDNPDVNTDIHYPNIPEFGTKEKLLMEREMTGIFISGHPLDPYEDSIKKFSQVSIADIIDGAEDDLNTSFVDGRRVQIAGIIMEKKNMITKNKNMMAFLRVEDLVGSIECVVFPNVYEKHSQILNEDSVIVVRGKLSVSDVEDTKILVESIVSISDMESVVEDSTEYRAVKKPEEKLFIKLKSKENVDEFRDVVSVLCKYKGDTPVIFYFSDERVSLTKKEICIEESKINDIRNEFKGILEFKDIILK